MWAAVCLLILGGGFGQIESAEAPATPVVQTAAKSEDRLSSNTAKDTFNFRPVDPVILNKEQKAVPDIWVLHFVYRNPRYIAVNIPGKGRRLVWYMRYMVYNKTGAERLFIPSFKLVTDSGKEYHDTVIPQAERAVKAKELDDNELNTVLLNSVRMTRKIEPSAEGADPTVYHGVAFFEEVDMNCKNFTIYVQGLSNGYSSFENPETGKKELLRKTLILRFEKPGDIYYPTPREIKNASEPEFDYL